MDMNYFRAIQGTIGIDNYTQSVIIENQQALKNELRQSINYKSNAMRNGKHQEIILVPHSNSKYKSDIITFPNGEMSVGDIFNVDGNNWLVVEVDLTNPIQKIGTAWLCNQLFKFQNYSSKILEYWGVIDDGSYSNSVDGNSQIRYLNNKVNIYLPYNDDTKYLYIDKRLATDKTYDKNGKCILEVYSIVGRGKPQNNDGHLLILEAQSGQYNPECDNLEEMICDYVIDNNLSQENDNELKCEIQGRQTIRSGGKAIYSAIFYKADGQVDNGIEPIWSIQNDNPSIKLLIVNQKAELSVNGSDDLVGYKIVLCCADKDKRYKASYEIEVV